MHYPKLICVLAAAALLAGCMSTRIATHQDAWQKLSKEDQQRLEKGELRAGDSEEVVRIALGAPDDVVLRTLPGGQQTVWLYDLTVLSETSRLGWIDSSHPGFEWVSTGERQITFQDGALISDAKTGTGGMDFGGFGYGRSGVNAELELANLDEAVGLTPEQRAKAGGILEKKAAALNAIPQAERFEKGMPIQEAAGVELRALLTPEQRQKRNDHYRAANGAGYAQERAVRSTERAFVADFVRSSKSIAARLGAVTSLSFLNGSSSQREDIRQGHYTYAVQGEKHSETLKIYWEKDPVSSPMSIVKIEAVDGSLISL